LGPGAAQFAHRRAGRNPTADFVATKTRFAIDGLIGEPVTGVESIAAKLNKAQAACTAWAAITGSACAEEDGDGD
jgi:hypothetical protein